MCATRIAAVLLVAVGLLVVAAVGCDQPTRDADLRTEPNSPPEVTAETAGPSGAAASAANQAASVDEVSRSAPSVAPADKADRAADEDELSGAAGPPATADARPGPRDTEAVRNATSLKANFNYAEALQKSLYFYQAQQSGELSPNNRVAWRGPACLADGQDIGHDLSGGWFDAGDHWTANLTMSFSSMVLAWSAIEQPKAYTESSQMDELLESLIHVNRYFLKCLLNPNCENPAEELQVAIGCGGKVGVPDPNVHAMWAPAEVAHLMTNRPTFVLNRDVPGGDVPAAMAAAMAASSMVIRQHVAALEDKRGYDDFDAAAFADQLLDAAEKLVLFAHVNAGPLLTRDLPEEKKNAILRQRNQALRSDGEVVEVGYRAAPFDKVFTAATFLHRAHQSRNAAYGDRWLDLAQQVYDGPYLAEENDASWKDFGNGNYGKLGALNMVRLVPQEEKFHQELQRFCVGFCGNKQTPGGLRLREWHAHEYASLRHANTAAVIALHYSEFVEQSPRLTGNTHWLRGMSPVELKEMFAREAQRQVDYALGANPYGRSYLVGFGNESFNHPHHRGAYGAWAGFVHLIPKEPEYRLQNRHVLYGALIGGPDHNDVFLSGKENQKWLPLPSGEGHDTFYDFPNRSEPVRKTGYQWNPADQPVQHVGDSKFNEVTLDYNAGITASFAWLTAHGLSAGEVLPDSQFPPAVERNNNTDLLTTDREFFVAARELKRLGQGVEIEATLFNRSRWPSRVCDQLSFRYAFTPDGNWKAADVTATVQSAQGEPTCTVETSADGRWWVSVAFPGDAIYPGDRIKKTDRRTVQLRIEAPSWSSANDWSYTGMDGQLRLLPHIVVFENGQPLDPELKSAFPSR